MLDNAPRIIIVNVNNQGVEWRDRDVQCIEKQKMVLKRLFMKQLRLQHRYPLTFSFHPTSESINPPPVVPAASASAEPMRLVTKSASVRGVANFMIRYVLCLYVNTSSTVEKIIKEK